MSDCHRMTGGLRCERGEGHSGPCGRLADFPTPARVVEGPTRIIAVRAFNDPQNAERWLANPGDYFPQTEKNAVLVLCADGETPDALMQRLATAEARVRELTAENDALREAVDEIEKAYDPSIFTPLDDAEVRACVGAMGATGIRAPSDRLHAGWGRHLVGVIRRRVREITESRAAPETPERTET